MQVPGDTSMTGSALSASIAAADMRVNPHGAIAFTVAPRSSSSKLSASVSPATAAFALA